MKTEGSKPGNSYSSIWNSLTKQKKCFSVCEIFLLSVCTILEVKIFHILKNTFFAWYGYSKCYYMNYQAYCPRFSEAL